jgi:glycosyltransferase involved in cell wall biosynthesis
MNPELALKPGQAIEHYCRIGWMEGRDPSDDFSTEFYLDKYPDIRNGALNPFFHYVFSGITESRLTQPEKSGQFEEDIRFGGLQSDIKSIAFYAAPKWDAVKKARPLFPGHLQPLRPIGRLGYYKISKETLSEQARSASLHGIYGFCFELPEPGSTSQRISPLHIFVKNRDIALNFAVCITADPTSDMSATCSNAASLFTDKRYIRVGQRPLLIVNVATTDVKLLKVLSNIRESIDSSFGTPAFIVVRLKQKTWERDDLTSLAAVTDGLLDLPADAPPSKARQSGSGNKTKLSTTAYSVVARQGAERAQIAAVSDFPIFVGITLPRDTSGTTASAPVVHTSFDGQVYRRWLDAAFEASRTAHARDRRFVFLDSWNDWNSGTHIEADDIKGYYRLNEISRALKGIPHNTPMPKVTVIVPNYNHANYLRKRLTSIYEQTYTNIEVFLLDDKSADNSRDVLDEFYHQYPDITTRVYNEQNSASPFSQWSNGIAMASGELVWIAESDDFCSLDFLENLVGAFEDESVLLAYGKSIFINEHQKILPHFFENYVGDLECRDQWNGPYTNTAHTEVRSALGLKNTIPNASGVLFRTPRSLPLLSDRDWLKMRVAGDWVFYLHIIRGGKIAYRPDAVNFFRRYEGSTAEATYRKDTFYREVGEASRTVARLYDVPLSVLDGCRHNYKYFYDIKVDGDDAQFEDWYNYAAVLEERALRKANILIPTMGFTPGGAEILPIRIANELKRQGHSVLFLNSGFYPFMSRIRKMLRNDIPVVNVPDTEIKNVIGEFGIEVLNTHQWHFQKLPLSYPEIFHSLKGRVAALHGMIEHNEAFETTEEQIAAADRNVSTWIYTADKNIAPFKACGLYQPNPDRFRKLPNGMEQPTVVAVPRAKLDIPEDAFVLVCVSRAIPDKGWHECLKAVTKARAISGRDIRLILVGNGPVYDDFLRNPPPSYIYPVGFSEDSVGYYAMSDMGIMLSKFKSESFPLTVVDCLFAGKPYIGTDVGEIPNMLTAGNQVAGTIIQLDDWTIPIDAVAQEIANFASNPERYRHALLAVPTVSKRYRIEEVVAEYVEVYQESMNRSMQG